MPGGQLTAVAGNGLVLLDWTSGEPLHARWADHLLLLGSRLARQKRGSGCQLVVAVSVPLRHYAAVLIATGWTLAQQAPEGTDILAAAKSTPLRTPVRMATDQYLVADRLYGIRLEQNVPQIRIGPSSWKIDMVRGLVADPDLPERRFGRTQVPRAGTLLEVTGHASNWAAEQCTATATVAIVGFCTRLEKELKLQAGWAGRRGPYDTLRDVLRPDDGKSAFYASTILPGGREFLGAIPTQTQLVVLDGATAIRWLPEVTAPVVVALIDRSSPDESAGLSVLQRRSMGQPVPLGSLRWQPLPGMEALAFEIPV